MFKPTVNKPASAEVELTVERLRCQICRKPAGVQYLITRAHDTGPMNYRSRYHNLYPEANSLTLTF